MFRRGRRTQAAAEPRWVILTVARHQPEADLIVNLLRDSDIPSYHRRGAGFDVPDFLAVGPRDVMVPPDLLDEARAVLAGGAGSDDESP